MTDMPQIRIILPCAAMAALTCAVWLRMYVERFREIRAKRIPPQAMATSRLAARVLQSTQATDNFRNLFELPVLFYVLCLALYVTGQASNLFVIAAWVFVLLRMAHSWIQCTHNTVKQRFMVYTASSLLLFGMWIAFAVRLIQLANLD